MHLGRTELLLEFDITTYDHREAEQAPEGTPALMGRPAVRIQLAFKDRQNQRISREEAEGIPGRQASISKGRGGSDTQRAQWV